MKFSLILSLGLGLLISLDVKATSDSHETRKNYLEDVFIWKISDELKLTAKQESQFSEIQRQLNLKKNDLNKKIQESAQAIGQYNSLQTKEIKQALKQHRQLLVDYNNISLNEHDQILKLLGPEKMAQFISVKSDLTLKIRALVTGEKVDEKNQDKSENPKKLPPPKVIDE